MKIIFRLFDADQPGFIFQPVIFSLMILLMACQGNPPNQSTDMQIIRLGQGQHEEFERIKSDFSKNNPGYSIEYLQAIESLAGEDKYRVLFVQEGQPEVELFDGFTTEVTVGDIIMLEPGISLQSDSAISFLQFVVPDAFPENIPKVIRPDWDPNITDVPGGCATETNAYRRILLTWKQEVGEYLYHALNAHRVRIMDSFSHYHPVKGGFDEFYLVQMALPDAKIITSNQVSSIIEPGTVSKSQALNLLKSTSLQVGDLVYLPRGVMHRGVDGVLAQVITIPGFIPGSEIGVDHHLNAINHRLNLNQQERLPYNLEAAKSSLIK